MSSRGKVYPFGIGSPDWQRVLNVKISPLGVPVSMARSTRRLVAKPAATFGFSTGKRRRRRRRG